MYEYMKCPPKKIEQCFQDGVDNISSHDFSRLPTFNIYFGVVILDIYTIKLLYHFGMGYILCTAKHVSCPGDVHLHSVG